MTQDENRVIKSENCIVCVLDILGYKGLIEKKFSKLEEVEKVYKIFLDSIPKSTNNEKLPLSAMMNAVKVQIISDMFLIILDIEELPDLDDFREINDYKEPGNKYILHIF